MLEIDSWNIANFLKELESQVNEIIEILFDNSPEFDIHGWQIFPSCIRLKFGGKDMRSISSRFRDSM